MVKSVIRIEGMTCGHCVNWIAQALLKVQGVAQAKVDLEKQCAYVSYDEACVTRQTLAEAVEKAGYAAAEFTDG